MHSFSSRNGEIYLLHRDSNPYKFRREQPAKNLLYPSFPGGIRFQSYLEDDSFKFKVARLANFPMFLYYNIIKVFERTMARSGASDLPRFYLSYVLKSINNCNRSLYICSKYNFDTLHLLYFRKRKKEKSTFHLFILLTTCTILILAY